MNLSGESVREIVKFYNIDINDILVIYDDVDFEVGTFKIRRGGSSGGHNGIRNIIDNLKTENIGRVRIGISKNEIPLECKDLLNETDAKEETIMLSLRLTEGIDLVDYQKQFSTNLLEEKKEAIDILIKNKFLLVEDNHLKATNEGFMVLDKIISMLAI